MDAIQYVHQQLNTKTQNKYPEFRAGDNIIVAYRIVEGDKVRIQDYKGDVIQISGAQQSKSFTVRKISNGVGVERIFPYACPNIDNITVVKKGRVRRAKLFYLRSMIGKKARIKELRIFK
ncbi:MAG TPA: 50S ribosomal protein L19 [Saprospiraceae bacterium]|jgi:large subunit ribosomal protein L19|nr:50S ribosomal protein L19 [Saprospiraceae bacterium]MCC6687573.1 50S ribosomal protein L19 [Saprospiraceae bacterium]HMX82552.1 50S ribosomal protein L19 [Saprospiraceae bacterium]HMX85852.1 50S ribosomal protein L19 [Saprospiraceae bacterium]HMZ73705.1 50S ribosomal protein L19 [Saprospiraceae bacterium]